MEPEGSSPHSQAPATCPYPEPAWSSSHSLIPLPKDPSSFQVPNLMSLFPCLGRTKVSVQVRGFVCEYFGTKYVLTGRSS
jgi:hypothetical protein